MCDEIDRVTRSFIWSKSNQDKGLHLVNWETVTLPVQEGGLGVHKAQEVNTSLLGKFLWDLLQNNDKLWVNIFSSKYLRSRSIFIINAQCPLLTSGGLFLKWLVFSRMGFVFVWRMGLLPFWFDCWTRYGLLCNKVDYVRITDSALQVKDCWVEGKWFLNNLWTVISPSLHDLIFEVIGPWFGDLKDRWVWSEGSAGVYSTMSAYKWLVSRRYTHLTSFSRTWIWCEGSFQSFLSYLVNFS